MPQATVPIPGLALFEALPGLYLVLSLDLRVIAVTEAFVTELQLLREQLIDHDLQTVAYLTRDGFSSNAFPMEEFLASASRVTHSRSPASMSTLEIKPASLLPHENRSTSRYWKRAMYPLFDDRGEISHLLHVWEDITEVRQARHELRRFEASLAEEEVRFRDFMDHCPAAAFLKDSAGRYLYTNATWRRQFDPEPIEWEGFTDFDFWPRETAELFQSSDRHCLKRGEVAQFEERVQDGSGQAHTFLVLKFPFRLHGQLLVGGMALDITDRDQPESEVRRLNEELEERVHLRTTDLEVANRELEAFSYSISHDLRAPLRAIGRFTRILMRDCSEQIPLKNLEELQLITDNTEHMEQLIDDLLEFSRLGRQAVHRQPLDMNELVRQCLEELQVEELNPPTEISQEPLPPAHGDRALLKQVWLNLLSNSLKYGQSQEVRRITIGSVRLSEQPAGPVYFVRDNGVGFDMRYAHKLFGVFQRLHSSDEFEGTGVGLAIVQRIILRHGGNIWVESKVGSGATFYFRLGSEECLRP